MQISLPKDQEDALIQKILKVKYPVHDICKRCVKTHCFEKGLTFDIKCTPIPAEKRETLPKESKNLSSKELFWYYAMTDIEFFAEKVCSFPLRYAQKEALMCNSNNIVLRLPRQSGKTITIAIASLYFAFTHPGKRVLIVTPYENQIRNIFDKMNEMIQGSPIAEFIHSTRTGKYYASQPFDIRFKGGSRISGFNVNQSGGDSIRGQSGDMMVLDELDYIAKEAVEASLAIMNANPDIRIMAASTPSGYRNFFWKWCTTTPYYKEIHYSYSEMEHYSLERDTEWKKILEADVYKREIDAEFTIQEAGVFNNAFLDKSLQMYPFDAVGSGYTPHDGVYCLGVDWNESVAGVHIVVVRYTPLDEKLTVSNIIIVPPSEFTQIRAVNKIIELNDYYRPKRIVVDEGFGLTQIQMMKKYGVDHPDSGLNTVLKVVNYNGDINTVDPITHGVVKQKIKPLIVSLTVRFLENNRLVLPKSEDFPSKLVGQMRDYMIESMSSGNVPKYSKGYVHTLEAYMNALYGFWTISPEAYLPHPPESFSPVTKPNHVQRAAGLSTKNFGKLRNTRFERSKRLLERRF